MASTWIIAINATYNCETRLLKANCSKKQIKEKMETLLLEIKETNQNPTQPVEKTEPVRIQEPYPDELYGCIKINQNYINIFAKKLSQLEKY